MSDYARANSGGATHFTDKDALTTGDADKKIVGAQFDAEFNAILTAANSKYDSNDIASQAQAEGLSSNTVLCTPLSVDYILKENSGVLSDIQTLADPGADRILFWDDSATPEGAWLTVGDGIEISTTTLQLPATLAGAGLTLTSGVLAVGGGNGITANADDVALTDAAATTSNPIDISSGTVDVDLTALTTLEGNGLAAGDIFLVDDGGTPKGIKVEEAGFRVQTAQTTQPLAAADMNTIMEFTGTSTLTLPLNSSEALPVGTPIVLNVKHATQELTVTAAASVTLVSIHHPAGAVAESDVVLAGGSALLYKTAADVWVLVGDIKDA